MSGVLVTVAFSGNTSTFAMAMDGRTIIEGADAAGIELPSQCRAGICGTCRGRLVRGEVRMLDNMMLDDAQLAAGFVLACQSLPLTAEIALEFDES